MFAGNGFECFLSGMERDVASRIINVERATKNLEYLPAHKIALMAKDIRDA
jgi:hypothetical protein